jgi:hypothetical protein
MNQTKCITSWLTSWTTTRRRTILLLVLLILMQILLVGDNVFLLSLLAKLANLMVDISHYHHALSTQRDQLLLQPDANVLCRKVQLRMNQL